MNTKEISDLFLREGKYHFARWSKPISPVVFGVDDESLTAIKVAFSDLLLMTPLQLSDFDKELGANLLIFFCSEWSELSEIPNLSKLIPELSTLLDTLNETGSNQYRTFSFTPNGAINVVIVLLKYDSELSSVSTQTLATSQMLQSLLLWAPDAFKDHSPIVRVKETNRCVLKPFYTALVRAAYDPTLPDYSIDQSHALRLQARVTRFLEVE